MPLTPYPIEPSRLSAILDRYRGFPLAPVSYATVRDYSDGVIFLPELAAIAKDLKDAQRPWMLKAILGHVPLGGASAGNRCR